MDDLERQRIEALLARLDTENQKFRDERDKTRAAFAYMGERTQKGLTLEALAKGAGILIKTAKEELDLARAELQEIQKHAKGRSRPAPTPMPIHRKPLTEEGLRALRDGAHTQEEYVVGQQVAPGLIVVQEQYLAKVSESLSKIHDLAGQLGDHPHAGAIQDWVHQVNPCVPEEQKTKPQAGVQNVQVQCIHCKGEGEVHDYRVANGKILEVYSVRNPFGAVPCPTCRGFGVVVATELRAVIQWESIKAR